MIDEQIKWDTGDDLDLEYDDDEVTADAYDQDDI